MTALLGAVVLVRISQFWSVLKIELPPPSRAPTWVGDISRC